MKKILVCAMLVAVAVSACSKTAGPGTVSNSAADLSVDPGYVYACDGRDQVVSLVKWHVKDLAVTEVRVDVHKGNEPRSEFSRGGGTGQEKTNDWVVDGVWFHLMDAKSGKELASYKVTSLPCN